MNPYLDAMQIVVPMTFFSGHRREPGRTRHMIGYSPPCHFITTVGRHLEPVKLALPILTLEDSLDSFDDTAKGRRNLFTRLLGELPSERDRCEWNFLRDTDSRIHSAFGLKLDFGSPQPVCEEQPQIADHCDLSEQCVGALTMAVLERMG